MSPYLNDHDLRMLRFHMEKALDCVERLMREIAPEDDAYSELDRLLEQYLGDNAFQQLALAEKAHKEWAEKESAKAYDNAVSMISSGVQP